MKRFLLIFLSFLSVVSCRKTPHGNTDVVPGHEISFQLATVDLLVGETFCPDASLLEGVTSMTSSVPEVARAGVSPLSVVALKPGRTVVTATDSRTGKSARMNVNVISLAGFERTVSKEDVFANGVRLHFNTVMQSFDLDLDNGFIYFNQCGGGKWSYLDVLSRRKLTDSASETGMDLPYFGHAQGMAAEPMEDGTTYCWAGCHGTLHTDGDYRFAQTIARFAYRNGKMPECESFYWIPDRCNLQISLDIPNDMAMIYASDTELSKGMLYGFRLSEMKAIKPSEVTLSMQRTFGGDSYRSDQVTEFTKVLAKDLSSIEPLFRFDLGRNYYNVQCYTLHNGKIYILNGTPEESGVSWINHCIFTVLGMDGGILGETVLDSCITADAVKAATGSDIGFFEPECIQVRDGHAYLGYAGRATWDVSGTPTLMRVPVILKLNLIDE